MASNVTMYAKLQRTSMTLNAAQKSSYHQCLHTLRFVLLMYGVPFDDSTLMLRSSKYEVPKAFPVRFGIVCDT